MRETGLTDVVRRAPGDEANNRIGLVRRDVQVLEHTRVGLKSMGMQVGKFMVSGVDVVAGGRRPASIAVGRDHGRGEWKRYAIRRPGHFGIAENERRYPAQVADRRDKRAADLQHDVRSRAANFAGQSRIVDAKFAEKIPFAGMHSTETFAFQLVGLQQLLRNILVAREQHDVVAMPAPRSDRVPEKVDMGGM